jgi:hypothetical protein
MVKVYQISGDLFQIQMIKFKFKNIPVHTRLLLVLRFVFHDLQIFLKSMSFSIIFRRTSAFTVTAEWILFYYCCWGIDLRPVNPDEIQESIRMERIFEDDLTNLLKINETLRKNAEFVCRDLEKYGIKGTTLTPRSNTIF